MKLNDSTTPTPSVAGAEERDATALTDEAIFALARQHMGGTKSFLLIHETDPLYAGHCEMPEDTRWSCSAVTAEQLIAFSRALLDRRPSEPTGTAGGWMPLPEERREREQFDKAVQHIGDVRLHIANCLRIWAAVHDGGTYADQCRIMANEVAKLPLPTPPSKEQSLHAAGAAGLVGDPDVLAFPEGERGEGR